MVNSIRSSGTSSTSNQVADLEDHAPDLGRVVVLDGVLQPADAERAIVAFWSRG